MTALPQPSEASTHRWPLPSPTADGPQATHGLAARSGHFRRCHDREARTNLGPPATLPTDGPQTVHGLVAHFDHLPATATTCLPGVQKNHELQPTSPAGGPPARCPLRSPSGYGGNLPPRRPDTPRAAAIFTTRRFSGVLPQPVHRRRATTRCCHCCHSPANPGSFPRQDAPLPS
jgi:hypothetical protein